MPSYPSRLLRFGWGYRGGTRECVFLGSSGRDWSCSNEFVLDTLETSAVTPRAIEPCKARVKNLCRSSCVVFHQGVSSWRSMLWPGTSRALQSLDLSDPRVVQLGREGTFGT